MDSEPLTLDPSKVESISIEKSKLVVSNSNMIILHLNYDISNDRLKVIHNGFDTETFHPPLR